MIGKLSHSQWSNLRVFMTNGGVSITAILAYFQLDIDAKNKKGAPFDPA